MQLTLIRIVRRNSLRLVQNLRMARKTGNIGKHNNHLSYAFDIGQNNTSDNNHLSYAFDTGQSNTSVQPMTSSGLNDC